MNGGAPGHAAAARTTRRLRASISAVWIVDSPSVDPRDLLHEADQLAQLFCGEPLFEEIRK